MRKVCLAIGVADAQQLAYLPGARNGAKAFGAWADKFGYQTEVLTDELDPVTVDGFKQRLEALLANAVSQETERAIIYFAGHGLTRDAADDLWLLSTWFGNQEAINVSGLVRKLDRYNIKQLVVVSDACRTLPTGAQDADLTEHKFPRGPVVEQTPQADHWRASSQYRAAFMVKGQTSEQDRCIFSGVLTDALWGHYPAAFEQTGDMRRITNFALAKCLQNEVPAVARRYKVKGQPIELTPDLRPGLWPPDNVYVDAPPQTPPPVTPWPAGGAVAQGDADSSGDPRPVGGTWSTRAPYLGTADAELARDETSVATTRGGPRGTNRRGRHSIDRSLLETSRTLSSRFARNIFMWDITLAENPLPAMSVQHSHFSVFDSNSTAVWEQSQEPVAFSTRGRYIGQTDIERMPQGNLYRGRASFPTKSVPLLIRVSAEHYVGAAVYQNRNTNFYITDRGAQGLMMGSRDEGFSAFVESDLAQSLAESEVAQAIVKLQFGSLSPDDAHQLAQGLRYQKHSNPVAGVIAAYLYNRIGDIDNIRRIALYYIQAGEPVPFDVALLARVSSERDSKGEIFITVPSVEAREGFGRDDAAFTRNAMEGGRGVVAGAFPWLRQGWILLDDEGEGALYPPGLSHLAQYLLPAPFTTLRGDGGRMLAHWLERGANTPFE